MHTPGGDLISSDAIYKCLLKHKGKITAYIPQYCYSGGMLIALACDEIIMGKNAFVGPCDVQLKDKNNSVFGSDYTSRDVIEKVIMEKKKLGQKVTEEWLAQGFEAEKIKEVQKNMVKKLLSSKENKNKYSEDAIDKIYNELFSGKYPHCHNFDYNDIQKIGINVKVDDMPNYIKNIFYIKLNKI